LATAIVVIVGTDIVSVPLSFLNFLCVKPNLIWEAGGSVYEAERSPIFGFLTDVTKMQKMD